MPRSKKKTEEEKISFDEFIENNDPNCFKPFYKQGSKALCYPLYVIENSKIDKGYMLYTDLSLKNNYNSKIHFSKYNITSAGYIISDKVNENFTLLKMEKEAALYMDEKSRNEIINLRIENITDTNSNKIISILLKVGIGVIALFIMILFFEYNSFFSTKQKEVSDEVVSDFKNAVTEYIEGETTFFSISHLERDEVDSITDNKEISDFLIESLDSLKDEEIANIIDSLDRSEFFSQNVNDYLEAKNNTAVKTINDIIKYEHLYGNNNFYDFETSLATIKSYLDEPTSVFISNEEGAYYSSSENRTLKNGTYADKNDGGSSKYTASYKGDFAILDHYHKYLDSYYQHQESFSETYYYKGKKLGEFDSYLDNFEDNSITKSIEDSKVYITDSYLVILNEEKKIFYGKNLNDTVGCYIDFGI